MSESEFSDEFLKLQIAQEFQKETTLPRTVEGLRRLQDELPGIDPLLASWSGVARECLQLASGLPPHLDTDEMLQVAFEGFLQAAARYDPSAGASLSTYAVHRARGAILDWLRKETRAIRRRPGPAEILRARAELRRSLRRPPCEDELASYLGLTADQLAREVQKSSSAQLLFPERAMEHVEADPSDTAWRAELKRVLAAALDGLPPEEARVLSLHYFDELSIREVARVTRQDKSRVSRLHGKALLSLRDRVEDWLGSTPEPPRRS